MTIHCTFTIVEKTIKRLLETIFLSLTAADFLPKFFLQLWQKNCVTKIVAKQNCGNKKDCEKIVAFRIVSHRSQHNHNQLLHSLGHKNISLLHFLKCFVTQSIYFQIYCIHPKHPNVFAFCGIEVVELCAVLAVPARDTFIYHNNRDNSIHAQS